MPLVNPPAALLGRVNAIGGGRTGRYEACSPAVSLSEKAEISSLAAGETCDWRCQPDPSGWLIRHERDGVSLRATLCKQ